MRASPVYALRAGMCFRNACAVECARILLTVLLPLLGIQASLAQIPVVTVDPAHSVTSTSAGITGTVNPQGQAAVCFVQWGADTSYGTAGPMAEVAPQNVPVAVSNEMIYLSPSTTYHYRLAATNSSGIGYSADMTMTTAAAPAGQPPTALTRPATSITTTSANLWGIVGSGGLFTTYYFRWGLDTSYGNALPQSWVASNDPQLNVYAVLSGLNPGTTYHFQVVATNTARTTFGADQSFTTQGFFTNNLDVFTYFVANGTITITAYSGPGGDVNIPSTVNGLPVTAIGDTAFVNNNSLTRITVPNGVITIGTASFADDMGLTNVALPNGLANIGDNAFNASGLTRVVIPDSVTNVGASAFSWCTSLADLTIGNHVLVLGTTAFANCPQLKRVVIPESVTRIEDGVLDFGGPMGLFALCSGLTNVTVGSGLTYLGIGAFVFCPNLTGVYFHGNAPSLNGGLYGERIFDYSDSVIVYYLPGTTGWGATFAGRPTMLWNPRVLTGDGNFGMRQGRFGFNISGTAGIPLVFEATTNPFAGPWVTLESCTLTNGSIYLTDPESASTYSARFYRVRSP